MNTARVNDYIALMERVARDAKLLARFNMHTWVGAEPRGGEDFRNIDEFVAEGSCGTTACLAGWVSLDPASQELGWLPGNMGNGFYPQFIDAAASRGTVEPTEGVSRDLGISWRTAARLTHLEWLPDEDSPGGYRAPGPLDMRDLLVLLRDEGEGVMCDRVEELAGVVFVAFEDREDDLEDDLEDD